MYNWTYFNQYKRDSQKCDLLDTAYAWKWQDVVPDGQY